MKKKNNKIILPKDIVKPDYDGGSIVNLMSSIVKASGGRPEYPELRILKSEELKKYKNILLVVLDGLGYEYLKRYGEKSFMMKNLRGTMTSVFPATTAAAITTFATGMAPQQHAMTGWFMNVRELGGVITPLKNAPRVGGALFSDVDIDPKLFFDMKPVDQKIKRKSYEVQHIKLSCSDYSSITHNKSKIIAYMNIKGFFEGMKRACKQKGDKYVYAYWGDVDSLKHVNGTKSLKVLKHFKKLDKGLEKISKTLKDTIMIITADHGLVDTGKKNIILMSRHPKFAETLSSALAGDSRTSYCYVHPDKTKEFESYIRKHFKNKCVMLTRKQAIESGLYGKGKPHPKLVERIGDYVLIWRKNYAFKDALLGQKENENKGSHGGASSTEMYVPLIVVKKG